MNESKGEISKPEGHSTVLRKKERRELSRIQQQLLSHLFLYIFIAESEYLFTYWACKVYFEYPNIIKSILYNKIMNSQHNILVLISLLYRLPLRWTCFDCCGLPWVCTAVRVVLSCTRLIYLWHKISESK